VRREAVLSCNGFDIAPRRTEFAIGLSLRQKDRCKVRPSFLSSLLAGTMLFAQSSIGITSVANNLSKLEKRMKVMNMKDSLVDRTIRKCRKPITETIISGVFAT
jgi:hypothetical protein